MPRAEPILATPAVILKPLPINTDGEPGCFFGGLPKMPDDMAWPGLIKERSRLSVPKSSQSINDPYHFLAQIDLNAVPKYLEVAGLNFPLPELPHTGTLYVFWTANFGKMEAQVLYTPLAAADLSERSAPENLRDLRKEWEMCPISVEGLSNCGRVLERQNFVLLPYLTSEVDEVDWEYTIAKQGDQPEELLDALYDASASVVLGDESVEDDYRLIQMFGTSIRQSTSVDPDADYVILFQLADEFGLPIRLDSYVMQVLITKQELAALRFDKAITSVGL